MTWLPGSDLVGDFTWCGLDTDVAVTDKVMDVLLERFGGFEAGPVEMVDDPAVLRGKRRKPRVRLPYEGPPLHELWVTAWAHLDRQGSSAELEFSCGTCGTEQWQLYGVERWDSHFDAERWQLVETKTERLLGAGVMVRAEELAGAAVFRVHEFPGWPFCTDPVRALIEQEGFTNVAFLEMGDVVND